MVVRDSWTEYLISGLRTFRNLFVLLWSPTTFKRVAVLLATFPKYTK